MINWGTKLRSHVNASSTKQRRSSSNQNTAKHSLRAQVVKGETDLEARNSQMRNINDTHILGEEVKGEEEKEDSQGDKELIGRTGARRSQEDGHSTSHVSKPPPFQENPRFSRCIDDQQMYSPHINIMSGNLMVD